MVLIAVNGSAQNISTGLWSFLVPANITLPEYEPDVKSLVHSLSQYRIEKCRKRLLAAGFNTSYSEFVALYAESQRRSREHGTGIGEIIEDAIQDSRSSDGANEAFGDNDEMDLTCTNVDISWGHVLPLLDQLSPGRWAPPVLVYALPSCIYVFSIGSYYKGKPDVFAFAGMNNSHIFIGRELGNVVVKPLPFIFAQPVNFVDLDGQNPILGPTSHGKVSSPPSPHSPLLFFILSVSHIQTVSLAVAPWDADLIIVTGWSSVDQNSDDEPILLTRSAGDSWEVSWSLILRNRYLPRFRTSPAISKQLFTVVTLLYLFVLPGSI